MPKPYQSIACSLHDEYEIAIMHKKHICIKWVDDIGEQHTEKILAKDILVKNREEFLVARTHDSAQRLYPVFLPLLARNNLAPVPGLPPLL